MTLFVCAYSASPSPSVLVSSLQQSRVARSYQDRCLLIASKGSIVRVRPQGFIFFGTAVRLLEEVKQHIMSQQSTSQSELGSISHPNYGSYQSLSNHDVDQIENQNPIRNNIQEKKNNVQNSNTSENFFLSIQNDNKNVTKVKVEFVVFDFSQVSGIDATAARACFLRLKNLLRASKVVVVYSELTHSIEGLLRAQGVIDDENNDDIGNLPNSVIIPVLDDALEWCEECLLDRFVSNLQIIE
jgi:SulP family sulfate permease